ncbi:MAG: hypothetical protein SO256_11120 [Gemmiger sp.]|uniref:hypothetical protein n=1 Tax=Gemmiger sp. TaxID=2049027 RepID=UPI002A7FE23E|nr:hypothetical protein [Gemmiger sp.]MDY4774268.1 hypothetical protein [Gemmiger sp.]
MPVLTSLYLCNRTVYAAVGVPAANGARVTAACQTELPEGCLINGIITNEGELTAALQGFFAANSLPTQRVALAAGGSQFNHRVLTLPRMNEKKRAAVLTRELSSGGADVTAPLDDYMLLSTDKKSKADTVLATRVESAVIENYIHLATACGLKLHSIDLALAGQIKLVGATPALAKQSFVVLQFDGDSLIAGLYEEGQYKYSTRSRLFNPRGTEASGTEIGQKLSGLIQFQTAAKSEHPITAVYFGGSTPADLAACTPACQALRLDAAEYPETANVKLPEGVKLADVALAAGNLIGR